MQFLEEEQENVDEDLDIRALEDGFVSWKFDSFNITWSTSLPQIADLVLPFGIW